MQRDSPKISIITVTLNSRDTVEDCIQSVLKQKYENIEYIIIDGGSTDGTLDIIDKYHDHISAWMSESDQGLYEAMNKGIMLATGDIVGIINSDDFYLDGDVIGSIANEFLRTNVESVFADLVYIKRNNKNKIVRHYDSSNFSPGIFTYGCMPAHPTFFAKREVYEKYGLFKTDYKIASDYELLARFLAKHKISYSYIPKVLVKMRTGGISSGYFRGNWIKNREALRACAENGIKTNILKILSKYLRKIPQLMPQPGLLNKYTGS